MGSSYAAFIAPLGHIAEAGLDGDGQLAAIQKYIELRMRSTNSEDFQWNYAVS